MGWPRIHFDDNPKLTNPPRLDCRTEYTQHTYTSTNTNINLFFLLETRGKDRFVVVVTLSRIPWQVSIKWRTTNQQRTTHDLESLFTSR